MSDEQAKQVYEKAGLGQAVGRGERPAVLVVDFSCGFTDPECRLGAVMTAEVEATKTLLDAARAKGLPVIFTTIGYTPSGKDGALWLRKVPALGDLELGGRFSMNKLVELTSANVAKFFGLYPRKGTIAVGSDADIVVWDPDKRLTISAKTHHSNVDYNLFEGTQVQGAPEVVLVRGQVIVEGDELVARPGAGQFVKRARFGEELLARAVAA